MEWERYLTQDLKGGRRGGSVDEIVDETRHC